jgi:integrase/recombinase XerD
VTEHPEPADFLAYLRLKNLASRTIEEYEKILNNLFEYFGGGSSPTQVTTADLRRYVASLQKRGLADKTVSNHVLVIKRFFGFLLTEGYILEDPSLGIPRPQMGKRLPKALSVPDTRRLFAAMGGGSAVERRDEIFFRLVYTCGLRIGEAVNIKLSDIDAVSGALRVVGKGDKERRVYLKPELLEELVDYVEEVGVETYLFPGRSGNEPITLRNMEMRFKSYLKAAGLPGDVTPHTLRHSIAVHYLINGAPITFVQRLLGHESLATTGIYTQLADDMTKNIALNTPLALDDSGRD